MSHFFHPADRLPRHKLTHIILHRTFKYLLVSSILPFRSKITVLGHTKKAEGCSYELVNSSPSLPFVNSGRLQRGVFKG